MENILFLVLGILLGCVVGAIYTGKFFLNQINKIKNKSDKNMMLYHLANEWLIKKQEGKNLAEYLSRQGYRKIAVYGMAYMGERFLDELKDSDVEVIYAIDQNASNIYAYIDVVTPDAKLSDVDAVIVTSIAYFDEVKEKLSNKLHCPIVALDDIIYAL